MVVRFTIPKNKDVHNILDAMEEEHSFYYAKHHQQIFAKDGEKRYCGLEKTALDYIWTTSNGNVFKIEHDVIPVPHDVIPVPSDYNCAFIGRRHALQVIAERFKIPRPSEFKMIVSQRPDLNPFDVTT